MAAAAEDDDFRAERPRRRAEEGGRGAAREGQPPPPHLPPGAGSAQLCAPDLAAARPERHAPRGLKRKAACGAEQPRRKRKAGGRAAGADEELLLAMALSRSLQEEEAARVRRLPAGRQDRTRRGRKSARGEKKNRVIPPRSPPTLLLQDLEKARRQTEERVALLLSEVGEFPSTPPLPSSRLLVLELSKKADWPVALPKGPPSSLWESSSLVGDSFPGHACVAGSTQPALPWQKDQRWMQSKALPLLDSVRPEIEEIPLQQRDCGRGLQGKSPGEEQDDAERCSQKEEGALQDLMELAGEGLTLTQWNPAAQKTEEPGQEWVPGNDPQSNSDQPHDEKLLSGSHSPPLLGLLAAAFKGMVNNPHLSDVQFQVDSGELFYAHMFVLYARCPPLMEVVNQSGFWVAEEGEAKTRRVLLSDVSGEAAVVFLNYLYTAEHFIPQHVLSDVAALALRFGVAELAALCTSHSRSGQPAVGASGQEGEGRVERFEELLKSMWVEEDEEDGVLLPEEPGSDSMVDEQELEEIYEFAFTQRKAEEERHGRERTGGAEVGAPPVEEGAEGRASRTWGSTRLPVWDARKEAVPGSPPGPMQDAEQSPLGAVSRKHLEALPELPEASKEPSEKSLLAVSWGESLELFQQSYSGREPSADAAGEDFPVKSSTPLGLEKGLLPFSQSFSRGRSQGLLGALADELPASPRRRGGFCSNLSLALFSPALPEAREKPCQREEQAHPELQRGASGCRGADDISCTPATVPPSPPVDLKGGPGLMLVPEDKGKLGQGKWQVEMMEFPLKEWEAFGGVEVDIPCCLARGSPLLRTLPGGEAAAGAERIPVPSTPPLSCRGLNDEQTVKPGLASGRDVQQPGDAQDSRCTPKSAVIPSPKRRSLQGGLSLGSHCPSSPRSSACQGRGGEAAAADMVVILDDSEEEAEAAPRLLRGSSVFQPDLPTYEDHSSHIFLLASPEGMATTKGGSCQLGSPARLWMTRSGTPPGGSHTAGRGPLPLLGRAEEEGCSSDDETEILPLTQRLPAAVPVPKTPVLVCQEREAPCSTPPTPMPSYSIMETPVLKKELSRFGVRRLPKQQMVVKLKEIFQYTHPRPDSRDTAAPLQPAMSCKTQAAVRQLTSAAPCSDFPKQRPRCLECPEALLARRCFGSSSGAGDQGQMAKRGCLPARTGKRTRAAESPMRGGQALVASQEAEGPLGSASDTSVVLHSSSTEFETSVPTEEEEDIPASQSTFLKADVLVVLRQFIHSRPALCRQILFYQPFELARLQFELKQNGIRIALGRLLEFLDAHCITFTTAEARRVKKQQTRHRGRRKRY